MTSLKLMCYYEKYPKQPNKWLVDEEPSLSRRKSKGGGEKTKEWEAAWGTSMSSMSHSTSREHFRPSYRTCYVTLCMENPSLIE